MTSALALYEATLREINRFASAEFDVEDYNHFINAAQDDILTEQVLSYLQSGVQSDALRRFVKVVKGTPAADGRLALEEDSYWVNKESFVAAFELADKSIKHIGVRWLSKDNQPLAYTNKYYRPSIENPYYLLSEKELQLVTGMPGKDVIPKELSYTYIRYPQRIRLKDSYEDDTNSEWPESFGLSLARRCATLFLENSQSTRTGTYTQINP